MFIWDPSVPCHQGVPIIDHHIRQSRSNLTHHGLHIRQRVQITVLHLIVFVCWSKCVSTRHFRFVKSYFESCVNYSFKKPQAVKSMSVHVMVVKQFIFSHWILSPLKMLNFDSKLYSVAQKSAFCICIFSVFVSSCPCIIRQALLTN